MLTVVDHPLLRRDLTILRDRTTPHGQFRTTIGDAAAILAYEAMRDLPLVEKPVETPLETTTGYVVQDEVVVVPVLRAGLGLVDGFVRFLPEARVGHLGMYRDEETHEPVDYYANIPDSVRRGSCSSSTRCSRRAAAPTPRSRTSKTAGRRGFASSASSPRPRASRHLEARHPDVDIVTATVDRELDANAYIRPGLGDAGDRIFGT